MTFFLSFLHTALAYPSLSEQLHTLPPSVHILPQVIVTLQHRSESRFTNARSLGGNSYLIPVASQQAAIDLAITLDNAPGLRASPDLVIPKQSFSTTFNDPYYEAQWYMEFLEMDELFSRGMGNDSVSVAIIDSGIDITHSDLQDKYHSPYDAFDQDNDPGPDPNEFCYANTTGICDEHGTAVAGIAVAQGNNSAGMVGICPDCQLIPIKMLGEGQGALSAEVAAFEHAIESGAAVINNSWGYSIAITAPPPLQEVIRRATTEGREGKGIAVVFAAGNENREVEEGEICSLENVICVSAINSYGYPTNYTNFGPAIDIAAPSATVSIAPNESSTTSFGGTSAAAPVVSGLVGWILSYYPQLTAEEIHSLLIDTAQPSPLVTHDEQGHHELYGYGILSPHNLLAAFEAEEVTENPQESSDDPVTEKPGGCQSAPSYPLWLVIFLILGRRSNIAAVHRHSPTMG